MEFKKGCGWKVCYDEGRNLKRESYIRILRMKL